MRDMKRSVFVLAAVMVLFSARAQSNKYDTLAVLIIDRMADVIGDLESCSFRLNVANDVEESSKGITKRFADFEVYMSGSDKMLVTTHGYKGHRELWYNGNQLAYYSFDENNYGVIKAPANIIKTIDSVNEAYGIEFPAADFFYPAFTDDLLQSSDSLRFLGMENIGSKNYFDVISYGKEMNIQFWINDDAYNLPGRFAITYKSKEGNPQYLGVFADWNINPKLPSAMFDFLPPPGASKVRMMSKTDR
jgi:hypothetical protein